MVDAYGGLFESLVMRWVIIYMIDGEVKGWFICCPSLWTLAVTYYWGML